MYVIPPSASGLLFDVPVCSSSQFLGEKETWVLQMWCLSRHLHVCVSNQGQPQTSSHHQVNGCSIISATFPQSASPLVARWPPQRRNKAWTPSKDLADLCGVFVPSMLWPSALLGTGGRPRGSRWHGFTFWGLCGYGSKMFYQNKQPGENELSFWMGTALTLAGLPLILELLEGPNRALYSDK